MSKVADTIVSKPCLRRIYVGRVRKYVSYYCLLPENHDTYNTGLSLIKLESVRKVFHNVLGLY